MLPLWPEVPNSEIYHIKMYSESTPTLKFNDNTYLNTYKFQKHLQRKQKKIYVFGTILVRHQTKARYWGDYMNNSEIKQNNNLEFHRF